MESPKTQNKNELKPKSNLNLYKNKIYKKNIKKKKKKKKKNLNKK